MILAHHMGEQLLPAVLAGGASLAPLLVLGARARLHALVHAFRRRGSGHEREAL